MPESGYPKNHEEYRNQPEVSPEEAAAFGLREHGHLYRRDEQDSKATGRKRQTNDALWHEALWRLVQ
jgi:hypothetical protein